MGGTMFVQGQVNEFYSPIYDTYKAATTTLLPANIVMFQNPQNQSIGPELTNMTMSGQLSAGESIDVNAVRIQFLGAAQADIIAIMQAYQVSLVYGGKTVFESTVDMTPGGGGINIAANSGVTDPRSVYTLPANYPILLTSGPSFNFYFKCGGTPPTTTAALFMRVYFDGLRRKLT